MSKMLSCFAATSSLLLDFTNESAELLPILENAD